MKTKSLFNRVPFLRAVGSGLLAAWLGSCGGAVSAMPVIQETIRVSADTLIEEATESLARGYDSVEGALRSAGLDRVVDQIKTLDDLQLHDIEAEELTRELYRRAEAHRAGQGDRVLAHLYQRAADQYPAVAQDKSPTYEHLRKVLDQEPSGRIDPADFKFAGPLEARRMKLSAAADRAVRELSYVYANGDLSELSRITTKAFGSNFDFGKHLARSKSTSDALTSALSAHTPPPSHEDGLRTLMKETSKRPAAVGRPEFRQALAELDAKSVGFEPGTDDIHRALAKNQDSLPSRVAQRQQAMSVGMRGSIAPRGNSATFNDLRRGSSSLWAQHGSGVSRQASAGQYTRYISESFGVPNTSSIRAASSAARPFARPAYRVASTPGAAKALAAGIKHAPKAYGRAIRSALGARGVAAGAEVTPPKGVKLRDIAWVANREDDRFGRIALQVTQPDGSVAMALSRTLFGDSFETAFDILWGGHVGTTAYTPGEVLVLMSMDPFSSPAPAETARLEQRGAAIEARARRVAEHDIPAQMQLMQEIEQLAQEFSELPRRVVFHPALHGRELAWTTSRVDFWFNDIGGLSSESARMNGSKPMPSEYRKIPVSQADTWQFHELPALIRIVDSKSGGPASVRVLSTQPTGKYSDRSHFGVSMFEYDAEGEGVPLKPLERLLQPMLDWLSTNHHDFVRLNDFSEAFTLLRWAQGESVMPVVLDLDGEPRPIATPDRVVIGDGPKVR